MEKYLKIKLLIPEEIWAAQTMCLPSIVAAIFASRPDARLETVIAAIGVIFHLPFSYTLHMHRALVDDPVTRTKIFKFDVSFIHFHSFLTGYAWFLQLSWLELFYHIFCIVNIVLSDPLTYSKSKNTIDIMCAIGVLKSSFGSFYRSKFLWLCAHVFWIIGFYVHNRKLLGPYSAAVFHIILVVPQYCIMLACQNHAII